MLRPTEPPVSQSRLHVPRRWPPTPPPSQGLRTLPPGAAADGRPSNSTPLFLTLFLTLATTDTRWSKDNGRFRVEAAPRSRQCIPNPWERSNLEKALGTQGAMVTRFDPDLAPSMFQTSRSAAFMVSQNPH